MSGPWEKFQAQQQEQASGPWTKFGSASEKANPTEGNSFLKNTAIGLGGAIVDLGLGLKQRLDEGAAALERTFGGQSINQALGMRNASEILPETQAEIEEKRKIDAPLLRTAGGKTGNFLGKAAPAIAAALVPGGQTLAASTITGLGLGFAEPTTDDESVLQNMAVGGAGGAAGYGVGKGIALGAEKLAERSATKAVANEAIDAVASRAKESGLVIPPTQTNPTIVNRALEGLSGKISTAQAASIKNQPIINRRAANAVGLPPDQPITVDALKALRTQAGQAYDAVSSVGAITPTKTYVDSLDDIVKPYIEAARSFPNAKPNPIIAEIDTLRTPSFDAASAVAKIKTLRADADAAYASGNKELGKALKSGANALEGAIDSHLSSIGGASDLLKGFREARQLIAKTYSVEGSLNNATGNVSAGKLAGQLKKGRPLSGELKEIAEFSQAFPKAAQDINSSMPGISPLDFFGAGGLSAITGNPAAMATVLARPVTRSAILSSPFQATMGTPAYTNRIAEIMASQPARIGMQAYGATYGLPSLPRE
jgi:hypothetical protein